MRTDRSFAPAGHRLDWGWGGMHERPCPCSRRTKAVVVPVGETLEFVVIVDHMCDCL